MKDLIERQAAIDSIESHIRTAEEPYQLSRADEVMNHAFEIAASCVYNLPSAEPEQPIRCGECKHYNAGFECLIEGYGIERNKNWFCADAERRTDAD